MNPNIVAIPDRTRKTLMNLRNYHGSVVRLARVARLSPTYLHKAARGEQTMMDRDTLRKVEQLLEDFNPGKRTGPPVKRAPWGSKKVAAIAAAEETPAPPAPPVRKKYKRRKVKLVRRAAHQPMPEVHALPLNGNGRGREEVVRALLNGMAIQAEIARRAIGEYLEPSAKETV